MTKRQKDYQQYLKSDHWKHLRYSVLKRDGFKCVKCGSACELQAHHVIYRRRFVDSLEQDLISVCKSCHESIHKVNGHQKEKVVVFKKKVLKESSRSTDGTPIIEDWKTFCKARSQRQITRKEFIQIRKRKFPNRKQQKGWWVGMYEGIPRPGSILS